MKKSVLILVLGITICIAGCGKVDVNTPNGSQATENSNVIIDTDSDKGEEKEDTSNSDDSNEWKDYMESVKAQSDVIKNSLANDALSQLDMNLKSQELYELWDGALNDLWGELKSRLPEDEFSKLLDEQRKWIKEKEKSVEEAGKEFEGGSMHALVVNEEAAKITEERAYELYELLIKQ